MKSKTKHLLIHLVLAVFCLFPQKSHGSTAESPAELEQRRADALENIQDAIDEDPDEAAAFLGSTPVNDLDIESLEAIGDKAALFVQNRRFEEERERQQERNRIRLMQDLQNSRH